MRISMVFLAPALLLLAFEISGAATREQVVGVPLSSDNYAEEAADFHVSPVSRLRTEQLRAETPLAVPGVRTITTRALQTLLRTTPNVVLLDVLGGSGHDTVPGALWLKGAGLGGSLNDSVQSRLAARLRSATGGDPTRAIVTFCRDSRCWLSYNTALRAVALGYTNVHWYRGGHEAWVAAGLPTERAVPESW